MNSLKHKPGVTIATATAATALLSAAVFGHHIHSQHVVLTEAPQTAVVEYEPTSFETTSVLSATLAIPLEELERVAEDSLPLTFSDRGHGDDVCLPKEVEIARGDIAGVFESVLETVTSNITVCAGTKYEFTAQRSPIDVSFVDGAIVASFRLGASGKGGLRGDIADFRNILIKQIDTSIDVEVEISFGVDETGCIALDVDPQLQPRHTTLEIVDGVNIPIGYITDIFIHQAEQDIRRALLDRFSCDQIAAELGETLWRSRAVPLDNNLRLIVEPKAIGLSSIGYSNDAVSLSAQLEASTLIVSADEPFAQQGGEPVFKSINAEGSYVDLDLGASIPYDVISDALSSNVPEQVEFQTDRGLIKIEPRFMEVYPAVEGLAVRLDFDADLPDRWLDASGTAYLVAQPAVEQTADGPVLRLRNVSFARHTDNIIWNSLTAVFQQEIIRSVESAAVLPLSAIEAELEQSANKVVADVGAEGDVDLIVQNVDLRIDQVSLGSSELHLRVRAKAEIEGAYKIASFVN